MSTPSGQPVSLPKTNLFTVPFMGGNLEDTECFLMTVRAGLTAAEEMRKRRRACSVK